MTTTRFVLPVLAAAAALAILAGCGGDSGSSTDPASVAPAETPVYIEATIQPTGTLKANLEGLASRVAGIDDLGGTLLSYVEQSAADSNEALDFDKEIQPWLGESAGIFLTEFDGSDFEGTGFAVQVDDTGEAQAFIDKKTESSDRKFEDSSYEGVDYKLDPSDESAVGIVGNFIVYAEDVTTFEAAVDADRGDSLADEENFKNLSPSSPEGSLADVFVNIGGLIEAAGSEVDPEALKIFESAGVEAEKASALVSLVPGSDNVEIDLTSDLGEAKSSVGGSGTEALLGSLPANSTAAIALANFGDTVGGVIDGIDESGISGQVPAGKLKSTMKQAGIDLDEITGSVEDAAVFAVGRNKRSLEGALVLTTDSADHASSTVSSVTSLLRATGTPFVPIDGEAKGFEIRSAGPGNKELVVAARDKRIAIGYGSVAATLALTPPKDSTLSKTRAYNEALDALGSTPISGFAAGRPLVRLVEGLISADEREQFAELRPYLTKIPFLAIGSEVKGDVAQARLILGVTK